MSAIYKGNDHKNGTDQTVFLQNNANIVNDCKTDTIIRFKTKDISLMVERKWNSISKVSLMDARCLKITEKVLFNITSEASDVYIFSEQKTLIKNAKNGPFWRVFENLKLAVKQCYQTDQF